MPKSSAFPHIDGLLDLACRDGVDIRPTLLRVLTDLYVQKPVHTAEEETQYIELATGLIDAVDEATRATVAATVARVTSSTASMRPVASSMYCVSSSDVCTGFCTYRSVSTRNNVGRISTPSRQARSNSPSMCGNAEVLGMTRRFTDTVNAEH